VPSHSLPSYRPEIDGIRAIAVLAVVFYHFGLPIGGGFIGVDVFFVISGYLIGGILWRELGDTGSLSLGRFYIRRFKRLAPAFFVMALATFLAAWAILLPFEFREFGKSLIAATIFLSNVFFYRGSGYFDSAAEDKPLLHTWSLAVEEQFYIVLPLLLLLLIRWRGAAQPFLWILAGLSLVACVVMTPSAPNATFFLFPFRAWELLAGVLLAIHGGQLRSAHWSWLGLILIAVSVIWITPEGFPGAMAILPVLGTLLLLAARREANPVNQLLSLRLPVFFGLISYSLYLWHWPIVTLSDYWRGGPAGPADTAILLLLSVVLAYASWRWVETPVRHDKSLSMPAVFGGVAVGSAALIGLGGWLYVKDGLPDRFGPNVRPHIAASADFLQDFSRCEVPSSGPFQGIEICPIGPKGAPRVLIWGDSHLRAFHAGLSLAADEAETPALILWRAGCPPFFDVVKVETAATPAQNAACTTANAQIERALAQDSSFESVLLVGRWSYYANGTGIGLDAENRITLQGDGPQARTFADAANATLTGLGARFDQVHVLRQVPEIPTYDSRIAARALAHGRDVPVADMQIAPDALSERIAPAEAPFVALAGTGAITWIDPWPRLCDATCSALNGETGLYFDNNHVTNTASLMLRDLFAPIFKTGFPP